MVDVSGHFAMALLFAAPAWLLWERRGALGFTAFALLTAMLPDTDLVLQQYLPLTHHGVTHTVVFVALVGVITGAIAARWLTAHLNAHAWIRSGAIPAQTVFIFATAGLLTGGLSHVFADVLSAPDAAAPLAPFWPMYGGHIIVDVIYYDSPIWNFGLLAVAILVHVTLARADRYPVTRRYSIGEREERVAPTTGEE